jgi:peptide/nickel transport system permease protein
MAVSAQTDALQGLEPGRGRGQRYAKGIGRFLRRKPLGAFGAVVLVLLVGAAALADLVTPFDPYVHSPDTLQSPGREHLAGTDQYGRDIFTRIIYGARISLVVGIGATVLSIIPATLIGISSAYFGKLVDYFVQRLVDAIQAVPGVILLITIVVVFGGGVWNVTLALAAPAMIVSSRVVRSAALQVMGQDYVTAARASGASDLRIMLRHVLPNVAAPVIIVASIGFGQFILAEASLSFLGYGVPAPEPSWGGMLASEGRAYMYAASHMFFAPALALSLVVFGVNMFGDALRDVLDPRLRGTGN